MRLRLRRLSLAAATSLFLYLLAAFAAWRGLLPGLPSESIALEIGLPVIATYWAIRSGFSLRFADPSLTMPQMLCATLVCMHLAYHGETARGAFLMIYMLIAVFGIFRLQARQFLLVGSVAAISYAVIIALTLRRPGSTMNLTVELIQWLVLVFLCPWFAFVGGYISMARARLRESNQQLAKAMQDIGAAMRVIQDQATHDELTGIHNRRFIMEAIHTEKSRAERTGEQFCVLLLDLDHFKRINDQFGHLAGDQTLIAISQTVARDMRAMDCFGRYGGEEFLLLMPRTMQAGAQNGAERMRVRISGTEFDHVEPGLRVTVSIGVAQWSTGESAEQLIARADQALYSAKAEGRNRVCAAAPRGAAIQ